MEIHEALPSGVQTTSKQEKVMLDVTALPTMEELERQYLNLVLAQTGGNKVKTAKILGFSVKTIYNKLDGYKENGPEIVRDSEKGS